MLAWAPLTAWGQKDENGGFGDSAIVLVMVVAVSENRSL